MTKNNKDTSFRTEKPTQEEPNTTLPKRAQNHRSGWVPAICIATLLYLGIELSGLVSSEALCCVYAILTFVLINALLSLWTAHRWLKQDISAFEQRRETEREKLPELRHLPSRERAYTSFFADIAAEHAGTEEAPHALSLYKERLRTILKATYPPNSQEIGIMPTLNDLREISYTSERAAAPSWHLSVATSVLLIVGILGTLVGVHEAIPATNGIHMELGDILPALYPSTIAVSFTVLLLILRGTYRHRVERYIGRLDRHTLRCYFPLFRPAEDTDSIFSKLGNQVSGFNNSLVSITSCIDRMHELISIIKKQQGRLRAINIQAEEALDSNKTDDYFNITRKNRSQLISLQKQTEIMKIAYRSLGENIEELKGILPKSVLQLFDTIKEESSRILPANTYTVDEIIKSETASGSFSDTIRGIEEAERVSGHLRTINSHWCKKQQEIAPLSWDMYHIATHGNDINSLEREVVNQAKSSGNNAERVKELYNNYKDSLYTATAAYNEYKQRLTEAIKVCNNLIGAEELSRIPVRLDTLASHIEDLTKRYAVEPLLTTKETIWLILLLSLILSNIILTYLKFTTIIDICSTLF